MDYEKMSDLMKVLGHPVRLQMVEGLIKHECNVNKIMEKLGIPQSTTSQHLALLKNKGIVSLRKEGVKTCYCVTNDLVKRLMAVLTKG
ncbi:MAG: metalloregulator ArsR/SmtB family transcription factor [Candidatus Omnitrophota bacterium]